MQGLTHLIAKVLVQMEPLPRRMTTRSFDLLMQAIGMVRHDAPEVFHAIERANPYAPAVRRRFFALAASLADELEAYDPAADFTPAGSQAINPPSEARNRVMDNEKMAAQMSGKGGFIAALDQSGGSTPGALQALRHPGQRL